MTTVKYHALPAGVSWPADIHRVIERTGARRIADLGAGAHPVLDAGYVARNHLEYTIFDISEQELDLAGSAYRRIVSDVTTSDFSPGSSFDLVLSRWFLEHIADPRQLHRNVYAMLSPGGRAIHFFPTLYSLPFVINRLLPEALSTRLLGASFAERSKFRARYRWCRGPTKTQIRRFEEAGFLVEEYVGFYGHPYYRRVPPLDAAKRWSAAGMARHPVPLLTSFASVTLRRPTKGTV